MSNPWSTTFDAQHLTTIDEVIQIIDARKEKRPLHLLFSDDQSALVDKLRTLRESGPIAGRRWEGTYSRGGRLAAGTCVVTLY